MKKRYQLLIIVVLTILAYSNIFANGFAMDDPDFIVNWQEAHSLSNIGAFFQGVVPRGHGGVYRPFRSVFYAISYQLWGSEPLGYHVQALLVNLVCTILVYLIVSELIQKVSKGKKVSKVSNGSPFGTSGTFDTFGTLPFLVALLFGLHPIHTEAVTFMTAGFDTIGVLFMLGAFWLYLKAVRNHLKSNIYYLISVGCALLAYFTYEMTLVLPLLLLWQELTLGKLGKLGKLGRRVGPYFLGVIFYFIAKLMLTHQVVRGAYMGGSVYYTFLVMTKAFLMYLYLLVFPISSNLVHILPGSIPTLGVADLKIGLLEKQSFWDPWSFISIIIFITIIIVIWTYRKKTPLVSFSLGWILISLLPVSQIVPLQVVMAERYLYISSVGFLLFLVLCINYLVSLFAERVQSLKLKMKNYNSKFKVFNFQLQLLTFNFVLLTVLYSYLTFQRNSEWRNDLTLWHAAVTKAPQSASAHNNLALQYSQAGNIDLAEKEYIETIRIDPEYNVALNNLGFLYLNTDRFDLAESLFKRALNNNPNFYPMLYGLSLVYEKEGKMDLAKEYRERAIKNNPINK